MRIRISTVKLHCQIEKSVELDDTDLFGSLGIPLEPIDDLHTSEYNKRVVESPLSTTLRFFHGTSKLA